MAWLFTKVGFFSVVKKGPEAKQGLVCVRSRFKDDLDNLRNTYVPTLGPTEERPHTDYPYRAFVPQEEFAEGMKALYADIDYSNFKDEVADTQGYERAHLYGEVWGTMFNAEARLKKQPMYSGARRR